MADLPSLRIDALEVVTSTYADSTVARALAALLPGGGAVDVVITRHADRMAHQRRRRFFETLDQTKAVIPQELVESDDFLHCFFATLGAAERTRRTEKIDLFARFLASAISTPSLRGSDEFEEYLGILDELSYREMVVLTILDRFERTSPNETGALTAMSHAASFWNEFLEAVTDALGVSVGEALAMLTRLNRTGLFAPFASELHGSTGRGRLTPVYNRLTEIVGKLAD